MDQALQKEIPASDQENKSHSQFSEATYKAVVKKLQTGMSNKDVAKVLDLCDKTVSNVKKHYVQYDITNPVTINKASNALHRNLDNDNMAAVRLVYNQLNEVNGLNDLKRKAKAPQVNITLDIGRLKSMVLDDITQDDAFDDRVKEVEGERE